MNKPWNIAVVLVGKTLSEKMIVSAGETETGGFYDKTGNWVTLENKGTNFLVSYTWFESSVTLENSRGVG